MKKFSLVFVILLLSVSSMLAQTEYVAGHITSNTTWSADTIKITADIFIDNNVKLTINPGSYIETQGHYFIEVNGCIVAEGTEADSIIFTVNDTVGFSTIFDFAGSWYGIKILNPDITNDSSKISYCRIQNVKDDWEPNNGIGGGAIVVDHFSKLEISNCLICNNKAENEMVSFSNGAGMSLHNNSNPIIKNNTFYKNYTTGKGGGIYCYKSNPNIFNNIFKENFTDIESTCFGGAIAIVNCNQASTLDTVVSRIINNVITDNYAYQGGGLYIEFSYPELLNNTICNNNASYGGGLYTKRSNPNFINSVFYYNQGSVSGSQVFIDPDEAACTPATNPNFFYCNVEYGVDGFGFFDGNVYCNGTYENNIEVTPLFSNVANRNYNLQENSPLINSGNPNNSFNMLQYDFVYGDRIVNDTIDIGAFEYSTISSVSGVSFNNKISVYPNPTNGVFKIKTNGIKRIRVFNSNGMLIKDIVESNNLVTVNILDESKGFYFLHITTVKGPEVVKLVRL